MRNTRPTQPRLDPQRWGRLADQLGINKADQHFVKLRDAYRQRHRQYHNAAHIVSCLRHLDECTHRAARDPLLEFALWCHDVVYRTYGKHNELRSADWAENILKSSACSAADVTTVRNMIMATCHGEDRIDRDQIPLTAEQKLVVDIDQTILAVSREQFGEFEHAIRKEYWSVPGKTFRTNRARLFTGLLRQQSIYQTPELEDRFEKPARKNLEHALRWLRHYQAL